MALAVLFDVITVHCFTCPHVERGVSPQAAHDQMEAHYAERHGALIRYLVGEVTPPSVLPRFRNPA